MDEKKILCKCKKITKGDVLHAIKKGAGSFKEVKEKTGLGSSCGKCKDNAKEFVKEQLKK